MIVDHGCLVGLVGLVGLVATMIVDHGLGLGLVAEHELSPHVGRPALVGDARPLDETSTRRRPVRRRCGTLDIHRALDVVAVAVDLDAHRMALPIEPLIGQHPHGARDRAGGPHDPGPRRVGELHSDAG